MKIAEVIVDIAHSEVDKIFDYECDESVQAGMRVAVPFGNRTATGFVIRIQTESRFDPSRLKKVLRAEEEIPSLTPESIYLAEKISLRYRCPLALCLRLFLPSELRKGKVRKKTVVYAALSGESFEIPARAPRQKELFEFLREKGEYPAAALRAQFSGALQALVKRGIVVLREETALRKPYQRKSEDETRPELTPAQTRALASILTTSKQASLLFGVTGSGKTEIYLRLIEESLKQGRGAIFLVPEISLTPQMLHKLRGRFQSEVAILHSGLSAGERYDEWMRLREGSARIAVGARSAIFAPIRNLGVIILDEEHDSGYLQESAPRYQTADIARLRAHYHGCKVVLGSATPSVESFRRALFGEFELVRLPERILHRPMPDVRIVDMRREIRRGNPSPFSAQLKTEIGECLKKGNQAILFLNRRGYAQTVMCLDCGEPVTCENCDVSLTYHREEGCLKCHYCGAVYPIPKRCLKCGGRLSYSGTGTQRIVRELNLLYPSARILRMDNDAASGKDGHDKILSAFARREADLLVGTQMIAKGHDFPGVTLAGILDADMSLHFPDYRSAERTFQLITQVGGRSGRADAAGTVILQTFEPENYIYRFAKNYDYEGFYRSEIALRESMAFPPFAKIVRVMAVGEVEEEVGRAIQDVYKKLGKTYAENREKFLFFKDMRSPVGRIQKKYRSQILMRLTDGNVLREIYEVVSGCKYRNVSVYVEENPANLS